MNMKLKIGLSQKLDRCDMNYEVIAHLTHNSAATLFADMLFDNLLYEKNSNSWYVWTGYCWRIESTGLSLDLARELVEWLGGRQQLEKRPVTESAAFISAIERLARTDRRFAVTPEVWNADQMLLATPGGTVNLATGCLRPADPKDLINKSTAATPADTADCPRWRQFLVEVTGGDGDLIRLLQQFAGYCLTGRTTEQALLFIWGPGGNGKSVFIDVLAGIMGTYAVTAPMETFTVNKYQGHSTELAMFSGARLVTASETEKGKTWAESRIKALTGGDPITARFMRQDNFTYKPLFKLVIAGNHKPVLMNVDDAARRRFNIVPFDKRPEQPDPLLQDKLRTEWPGILRWMIEGCLDWQQNGLLRPSIVSSATANYFEEQDELQQWLDECCEVEVGNESLCASSSDLWNHWKEYAAVNMLKVGNRNTFADILKQKGLVMKRGSQGKRNFIGIRIENE